MCIRDRVDAGESEFCAGLPLSLIPARLVWSGRGQARERRWSQEGPGEIRERSDRVRGLLAEPAHPQGADLDAGSGAPRLAGAGKGTPTRQGLVAAQMSGSQSGAGLLNGPGLCQSVEVSISGSWARYLR